MDETLLSVERFALGPREKMDGARLVLLRDSERSLCLWLLRLRLLSLERECECDECLCLLELRRREDVEGANGYRKLMPRFRRVG